MVNRFEFCSSYTEASKYRTNAETVPCADLIGDIGDAFVLSENDNVDRASRTLYGYGSVHVMGQMETFILTVKARCMVRCQYFFVYSSSQSPLHMYR